MAVLQQYAYGISKLANDILEKLAEQDHVGMTTEIEMLISNEWRRRCCDLAPLGSFGWTMNCEKEENNGHYSWTLGRDFDDDLKALAAGDGLSIVEELRLLVDEEMSKRNRQNGDAPVHLSTAQRYMLFAIAEHSDISEMTLLDKLIGQEYAALNQAIGNVTKSIDDSIRTQMEEMKDAGK